MNTSPLICAKFRNGTTSVKVWAKKDAPKRLFLKHFGAPIFPHTSTIVIPSQNFATGEQPIIFFAKKVKTF